MGDEDSDLREERIDGKTVYAGRILDLEVDRVLVPNGGEAFREVVRHPGAVVVLPLLPDGRVVFVRQHRYPTDEVLVELPAGKLDSGEEPSGCAVRELEEETGWRAAKIGELGWFYTTPGFSDEVLHAFLATGLEAVSDHMPDEDEAIDIVTWTVAQAFDACRDGRIRDSKTIATLFLAQLQGFI